MATYQRGCRCSGCVAAKSAWQQVWNMAEGYAATWVRANHPDVWEDSLNRAYERRGMTRRRRGNPGNASASRPSTAR
jgi:hypothetical protein